MKGPCDNSTFIMADSSSGSCVVRCQTCSKQGGFDFRVGTFDILDDFEFQLTVNSTQGTFDGVPELGPRRPLTQMRPGSFCLTNTFVYPSVVVLNPR